MSSQFTPGPWELAPFSYGDELVNVVKDYKLIPNGAQAQWIAELDAAIDFDSDREAQIEEMYANAHLIAAAPDLYAALARYVEHFGDPLKVARAALAKARGDQS